MDENGKLARVVIKNILLKHSLCEKQAVFFLIHTNRLTRHAAEVGIVKNHWIDNL